MTIDRFFINGKIVFFKNHAMITMIRVIYWGLNLSRLSRVFIAFGFAPFVKLLNKEKLIKKRLLLMQQYIKKYFFFDRFLKRNYDYRVDFFVKNGHYRGFCMRLGLPVKGQRTHTNGSTSSKLNRRRISAMLLSALTPANKKKQFVKNKNDKKNKNATKNKNDKKNKNTTKNKNTKKK